MRCFRTSRAALRLVEGRDFNGETVRKRAVVLDTDPEIERLLVDLARATPDWRKLEQVEAMIKATRSLAMAGLKDRHPQASGEELRKRFAALVLDRETVIRIYNWDPDIEGY
jgi:hypothetical protein